MKHRQFNQVFKQELSKFKTFVEQQKSTAVKTMSYHDKRLSEYYHSVDLNKKVDMFTGYKRYCELQEILQERTRFKPIHQTTVSSCDKLLDVLRECIG